MVCLTLVHETGICCIYLIHHTLNTCLLPHLSASLLSFYAHWREIKGRLQDRCLAHLPFNFNIYALSIFSLLN